MDLMMLIKDYQTLIVGFVTLTVMLLTLIIMFNAYRQDYRQSYRQIESMKKARHSELFMHLVTLWNSQPAIKSRKKIYEIRIKKESLYKKMMEYLETDPTEADSLSFIGNFFDYIGMLVVDKYIDDPTPIIDYFGGMICFYYHEVYENYINEVEKEELHVLKNFKKLVEEIISCEDFLPKVKQTKNDH